MFLSSFKGSEPEYTLIVTPNPGKIHIHTDTYMNIYPKTEFLVTKVQTV